MGQLRVPPHAALQVVVALPVPTQVDGVRVHVYVHEVVHDLALDVVLHPVDQEPATHIHHLNERQLPGKETRLRITNLKAPGCPFLHCDCIHTC